MRYTIYTIRTIDEGKIVYVGKTKNFERRKKEHLGLYSLNTKEWLAEIGIDNVFIEPVTEFGTEEDALKCEDELILKYDTITNGYNKQRSGLIATEDHEEYHRDYYREYYQKNDKYREWIKEYQQTEKYKESRREYEKTDKVKERRRKYEQTDKRKEYHRDYRAAKKMGVSVAEYREIKKG